MIEQRELVPNKGNAYLNVIVNGRPTSINMLSKAFRLEIVQRHNNYLDLVCIMDTLLVCLEEPDGGTPENRANALAKGRALFAKLGWTEALLHELEKIQ